MSASQLRMWLAAPMASLFLMLGVCAFAIRGPQGSIGLPIPIQKIRSHTQSYFCEDDRRIIVRITDDGRIWINETGMTPVKLGVVLKQINEYRSEHVTYLMASPSTPYQQFADTLNIIQSSVSGIHVILITPELQRYFEPIAIPITAQKLKDYGVCPLEWKENGFDAPSIYSSDETYSGSSGTHKTASSASTNQSARENP